MSVGSNSETTCLQDMCKEMNIPYIVVGDATKNSVTFYFIYSHIPSWIFY